MNTAPIIIHKHPVGLFLIALAGIGAISLLLGITSSLFTQGQLTVQLYLLVVVAFVAIVLSTVVSLYVYNLSTITLTTESVDVSNWRSLFQDSAGTTEWRNIQDVTAKKNGILSFIFDYGTLTIQTAGTEDNLVLPMVPRIEYWRSYVEKLANDAKTPVASS